MAPKSSLPSEKMITISYEKYLNSQNELVNAINQHYNVASTMMMASSRSMQTVMAAMFRVRESAHAVLTNDGADELPEGLDNYSALATLLKKDQNELLNPLSMPTFGDLGTGLTSGPPGKKLRKKRAPKDPNAPKRPQTAFFLYLDANRGAVKTELGDVAKPGDVARAQRERWNTLPEKDKEVYKAMYRANFEGYRQEMEAFKARGGKVSDADLHLEDDDAALADPSGPADASDSESDVDSEDSDPEPVKTPTPEPPPTKKGKKAAAKPPAKTAASKKAEAAAAKASDPAPLPEKQKSPEKKKAKASAAASTPAEKKKSKKPAKSASPEESRKAKPVESPEASKKKRKSTGPELEEKRKKRKEAHGDDF